MKRIILFTLAVFFSHAVSSQIKVNNNNHVGINQDYPTSLLSVYGAGNSYSTAYVESNSSSDRSRAMHLTNYNTSNNYGYGLMISSYLNSSSASKLYGLFSSAYSSSYINKYRTYGVFGQAGNATSGYNYGIYGQLSGSADGAAIFAATPGKYDIKVNGVYAGYFRGNVFIENDLDVDGIFIDSDIKLKKDIRYLKNDASTQISKIKELHSIRYKLKTPIELSSWITESKSDTLDISLERENYTEKKYTSDKLGLSAQEVEKAFPELVKKNKDGYLSVNYIGLIPVLIEGLKEQQEMIEELQEQLKSIQLELRKLNEFPAK